MDATLLKESSDTSRPSMVSEIVCWSDSSRSSNPRMSSGSVMIFVVGLARTNVSKMHLTWWYWRISPPVLLYGFVTTCNIYVYIYIYIQIMSKIVYPFTLKYRLTIEGHWLSWKKYFMLGSNRHCLLTRRFKYYTRNLHTLKPTLHFVSLTNQIKFFCLSL